VVAEATSGYNDGSGLLPKLGTHGSSLKLMINLLHLYSLLYVSTLTSFITLVFLPKLVDFEGLRLVISIWRFTPLS
jgi:hypothetical protein